MVGHPPVLDPTAGPPRDGRFTYEPHRNDAVIVRVLVGLQRAHGENPSADGGSFSAAASFFCKYLTSSSVMVGGLDHNTSHCIGLSSQIQRREMHRPYVFGSRLCRTGSAGTMVTPNVHGRPHWMPVLTLRAIRSGNGCVLSVFTVSPYSTSCSSSAASKSLCFIQTSAPPSSTTW